MSISEIEQVRLEQNWFNVCDLGQSDMSKVTGSDPEYVLDRIDRFNTLGTYLVEVVGVYATELKDWLHSGMKSLDMQRPIDVLAEDDGFEKVFEVAEEWFADMQDLEAQGILQTGITSNGERESDTVWNPSDITKATALLAVSAYDEIFRDFMSQDKKTGWDTLVSATDGSYVRHQYSSNGLEAYKIELPDGEHRTSGMNIMLLSEGSVTRGIIKVEMWNRSRGSRPADPEEDIPHDFSPTPSSFEILRFSQTIKRLARNGDLKQ